MNKNFKNGTQNINRKNNKKSFGSGKNLTLLLLTLPTLIVVFVMNYLPLYGLIIPFKKINVRLGILKSPWCGFDNFRFLFNSNDILVALKNTVLYNLIFIVIGTVAAIFVALMLFEMGKKAVKTYQTALLIPYFLSWVVVAYIVNSLLDSEYGIMNNVLATMGREPVNWYNEAKHWPFILVLVNVLKSVGYSAIVYYATLMGIDPEYYEAAKLDGASKIQQIFYITLPMIKNMIIMLTILSIGKIFYADFGLFYNVTLNSPLIYSATDVIDTYVYRALMTIGDVGISATTGFCQSVLGFILVLVTNWITNKIEPDSALF